MRNTVQAQQRRVVRRGLGAGFFVALGLTLASLILFFAGSHGFFFGIVLGLIATLNLYFGGTADEDFEIGSDNQNNATQIGQIALDDIQRGFMDGHNGVGSRAYLSSNPHD